jgi:putative endonuclease
MGKAPFKRRGTFFVYILRCRDGAYYTGSTKDLEARIKLHNRGRGAKYVRCRLPVELVYSRAYRYFKLAVSEERRIKKLPRKGKESLILNRGRRIRRKRAG